MVDGQKAWTYLNKDPFILAQKLHSIRSSNLLLDSLRASRNTYSKLLNLTSLGERVPYFLIYKTRHDKIPGRIWLKLKLA